MNEILIWECIFLPCCFWIFLYSQTAEAADTPENSHLLDLSVTLIIHLNKVGLKPWFDYGWWLHIISTTISYTVCIISALDHCDLWVSFFSFSLSLSLQVCLYILYLLYRTFRMLLLTWLITSQRFRLRSFLWHKNQIQNTCLCIPGIKRCCTTLSMRSGSELQTCMPTNVFNFRALGVSFPEV